MSILAGTRERRRRKSVRRRSADVPGERLAQSATAACRGEESPTKRDDGHEAPYPSTEQVQAWAASVPSGNIALRMPPTVVGIDVDGYGGRNGLRTLELAEVECGPLPPT